LKFFDVGSNQLTGPIPSLSGLTALQYFDVGSNQLTGPIPSLSGLTALQNFYVNNNHLTGPVPAAPTSLPAGSSNLCGNRLISSGNPAIDAAWVTAQDPNVVAGSTG
jgi:Leucine-rich repeat (LRR) protein